MIIIVKSAQLFEHLARDKSIDVKLDLPEDLPAIYADGDRVTQVLSNMIGNAIKFSPDGSQITVHAGMHDQVLRVSVVDSGPGIPLDNVPHIFDRFWHARRTSSVRGTGLGLAIAQGLVLAHGGRIWLDSSPGTGSTFTSLCRCRPIHRTSTSRLGR